MIATTEYLFYPINNKYTRYYFNIIDNAKNRNFSSKKKAKKYLNCYIDGHHIIPRSLGGSDDKGNIVYLTLREHIIVHHLLIYMFPKDSISEKCMVEAYWSMCNGNNRGIRGNEIKSNITSRQYEYIRSLFIKRHAIESAKILNFPEVKLKIKNRASRFYKITSIDR